MSGFSPNPSQLAVMECRDQLCVIAGAGSGKTGTLVSTLVRRLEEAFNAGGDHSLDITDLLTLTFTEKAAAELRQRLAEAFGQKQREAADRRAAEFWRSQAARLDRADLGTIHGYALKLIRENAPALGLASAPAIDEDARSLKNDLAQIITDWLDQGDPDLLTLLNQYPLKTLTGMLETCAVKISSWGLAALTADLSAPEIDLIQRFSQFKELAAEALNLVRSGGLNPEKPYYAKVLTAMEALEDHLGPPAEDLAADADRVLARATQLIVQSGDWFSTQGRPMKKKLVEFSALLTAQRAEQLAVPLKTSLLTLANRLPQSLADRKRRRGVINFDDILILARRLLATRPEVRGREIKRRRHILIDEFQDTNRLQADLLAYLLLPPDDETVYPENHDLWRRMDWASLHWGHTPPSPRQCSDGSAELELKRPPTLTTPRFSVFGDLKQSIYRFRGAEVEVMSGLGRAFENGGGRLLALDHNYRSQGPLIRFFNTMFQAHLGGDFGLLDHQESIRPALYEGPHVVQLRTVERPAGAAARAREQARTLVRYLFDLFSGRSPVKVADGSPEGRRPGPGDVAVLFRRFAWAPVFKEAILEAGWRCRVAAGDNPFAYAEVRALLAAVQYLYGLDRELSLAAVLRSPLGPVSDDGLLRLAWPGPPGSATAPCHLGEYFTGDRPWPQGLETDDLTVLTELRALMAELAPLAGRLTTVEILERLAEERRLIPLAVREVDGADRVRAITTFLALSRTVGRGGTHQPLNPAEELMELRGSWDSRRDGGETGPDDQAVTLMTVHASKGLEFPVVVLAEADSRPRSQTGPVCVSGEGLVALKFKDALGSTVKPADFSAIEEREKELEARENGRLFYVAATRARDQLVFLGWPDPKRAINVDVSEEEAKPKKTRSKSDNKPVSSGGAPGTIWLEALIDCPEAAALTRVVEYTAEELGLEPVERAAKTSLEPAASGRSKLMEPMRLVNFALPVTALGLLLTEPEAFYRQNHLRLKTTPEPLLSDVGEREAAAKPVSDQRLAPDEAGTLFHAVMEVVDPLRPEVSALVAREAARLGLVPGRSEAAGLAAKVEALLAGPVGTAWRDGLAAGFPDYREMPFALRLPAPTGEGTVTLSGIIDLFFQTPDGGGHIVDYKLASLKPGPRLAAYEIQVRVYAQALIVNGFSGSLDADLYFAGGRPQIVPVSLDLPTPIAPVLTGLAEKFQLLKNTRPLRPNRPGPQNIVYF